MLAAAGALPMIACAEPPRSREEALRLLIQNPSPAPPYFGKEFDSWDPQFPPPPGTKTFAMSQSYPARYDPDEKFPWEVVDFRTHPDEYLRVVLDYCTDGLAEQDFDVRKVKIHPATGAPRWYHAPWQHDDGATKKRKGREYLRGLTREKDVDPQGLHSRQTERQQAWAIGYYNERGAYTLGRVWRTLSGYPDPSQAVFPPQTVTFKLLFTDAIPTQVPYLHDTLVWKAHIPKDASSDEREDRDMHLLQIDIAVKDPRVAGGSGWIFGTFIYDASARGKTVWDRMLPVGLSWGDDLDAGYDPRWDGERGAYLNRELKQSRINPALVARSERNVSSPKEAFVTHLGLGGRLNGPVDNSGSSCISCHGHAGVWHWFWEDGPIRESADRGVFNENFGELMPFLASIPRDGGRRGSIRDSAEFPVSEFASWFRTIPPNAHLEIAEFKPRIGDQLARGYFMTTDYSLQIAGGIRNFYQAVRRDPVLVEHLRKLGLLRGDARAFREATPEPVNRGDAPEPK